MGSGKADAGVDRAPAGRLRWRIKLPRWGRGGEISLTAGKLADISTVGYILGNDPVGDDDG
jgi:hypothetical protein